MYLRNVTNRFISWLSSLVSIVMNQKRSNDTAFLAFYIKIFGVFAPLLLQGLLKNCRQLILYSILIFLFSFRRGKKSLKSAKNVPSFVCNTLYTMQCPPPVRKGKQGRFRTPKVARSKVSNTTPLFPKSPWEEEEGLGGNRIRQTSDGRGKGGENKGEEPRLMHYGWVSDQRVFCREKIQRSKKGYVLLLDWRTAIQTS